jgi:hypothetical protein
VAEKAEAKVAVLKAARSALKSRHLEAKPQRRRPVHRRLRRMVA